MTPNDVGFLFGVITLIIAVPGFLYYVMMIYSDIKEERRRKKILSKYI